MAIIKLNDKVIVLLTSKQLYNQVEQVANALIEEQKFNDKILEQNIELEERLGKLMSENFELKEENWKFKREIEELKFRLGESD